jgi:hypothetical protein
MGGFYRGAYASPLNRPQLADAFSPTAMRLFAVRWSILLLLQVLEQVKTGEVALLDLYPVRTLTRLTFRGPVALRLHLREQALKCLGSLFATTPEVGTASRTRIRN